MPDGRFMVNCGGIDGGSNPTDANAYPENIPSDNTWLQNPTLKALSKAFPGQVGLLLRKIFGFRGGVERGQRELERKF